MKSWLRFLNRLLSVFIGLVLVTASLYAGYALWDNQQIYALADEVYRETPAFSQNSETSETAVENRSEDTDQVEKKGKFADTLLKWQEVNPDVNGWINMKGTKIGYPIVQGITNLDYISTDVQGNYAIVGSIFLDSRNHPEYQDVYSLLYGHNMSEHRMFSDVNLYKEKQFFYENQTGILYTVEEDHELQTLSIVLTSASNTFMLNPLSWNSFTNEEIITHIQEEALFVSEKGMAALQAKLDAEEPVRILALSTCSNEFTDARTILLTLMDPDKFSEGTEEEAFTEVSDEVHDETSEESSEEVPAEDQKAER